MQGLSKLVEAYRQQILKIVHFVFTPKRHDVTFVVVILPAGFDRLHERCNSMHRLCCAMYQRRYKALSRVSQARIAGKLYQASRESALTV